MKDEDAHVARDLRCAGKHSNYHWDGILLTSGVRVSTATEGARSTTTGIYEWEQMSGKESSSLKSACCQDSVCKFGECRHR
jgi:hypothetical protein